MSPLGPDDPNSGRPVSATPFQAKALGRLAMPASQPLSPLFPLTSILVNTSPEPSTNCSCRGHQRPFAAQTSHQPPSSRCPGSMVQSIPSAPGHLLLLVHKHLPPRLCLCWILFLRVLSRLLLFSFNPEVSQRCVLGPLASLFKPKLLVIVQSQGVKHQYTAHSQRTSPALSPHIQTCTPVYSAPAPGCVTDASVILSKTQLSVLYPNLACPRGLHLG